MKPREHFVKKLKEYDDKLFCKWNWETHTWEIWRKMYWGDRLITPVTELVLEGRGKDGYCPLDSRILGWLFLADSQRKDLAIGWKWIADRRFKKTYEDKREVLKRKFKEIASDSYNLVNRSLINPILDHSDWVPPNVQTHYKDRIMFRDADNARRYFGDAD